MTEPNRDPRTVLTRPAPPPDLLLRYGDGPEQIADVRLPAPGQPRRPVVLFLHGGFWMAEYDRAHAGPLAADLAARGYPVVCLEYRRIGQDGGGWPGTLDDVVAGAAALPGLLAAHGLDATGPVLAGHSAGGQLALWLAGRVPSRGVLALAPVADLAAGYALGLGDGAVAALLGGSPDEVPGRYAEADPVRRVPLPVPVVVVHGSLDPWVPVSIGRDYVTAAVAAGGDARLVELSQVEHYGVIDPQSLAWPHVLSALRSVAGVDGTPQRR